MLRATGGVFASNHETADCPPQGVFNMTTVPFDRDAQAKAFARFLEKRPIVCVEPTPLCPCGQYRTGKWVPPVGLDTRDKIDGKSVVVRALPWPRFRGAGGDKLRLGVWEAETLERFEQGLRLAGFVGRDQGVVQLREDGLHFGIERIQFRMHRSIPKPRAKPDCSPMASKETASVLDGKGHNPSAARAGVHPDRNLRIPSRFTGRAKRLLD